MLRISCVFFVDVFFNDTATTEIYTLSLHDALPIYRSRARARRAASLVGDLESREAAAVGAENGRSEEHTSELQSRRDLVCRLLLEKKKKHKNRILIQTKKKKKKNK